MPEARIEGSNGLVSLAKTPIPHALVAPLRAAALVVNALEQRRSACDRAERSRSHTDRLRDELGRSGTDGARETIITARTVRTPGSGAQVSCYPQRSCQRRCRCLAPAPRSTPSRLLLRYPAPRHPSPATGQTWRTLGRRYRGEAGRLRAPRISPQTPTGEQLRFSSDTNVASTWNDLRRHA